MISEGSRDTEDWSNDAENTALHLKKCKKIIFIISQYYCFYYIVDQINTVLVSMRHFSQKQKHLNDP